MQSLAVTFTETFSLGSVMVIAGLFVAAGALFGQFRRGVVKELRDSLDTARTEIGIERDRANRIEHEMRALEAANAALAAEVKTLRELLVGGDHLAVAITDAITNEGARITATVLEALHSQRQQ